MIHNTVSGGQYQVAELTGWQKLGDPLFHFIVSNIEARGNNTALVDAADKLYNDLSCSVVINNCELTNVT